VGIKNTLFGGQAYTRKKGKSEMKTMNERIEWADEEPWGAATREMRCKRAHNLHRSLYKLVQGGSSYPSNNQLECAALEQRRILSGRNQLDDQKQSFHVLPSRYLTIIRFSFAVLQTLPPCELRSDNRYAY
jgi:hypothetical protein